MSRTLCRHQLPVRCPSTECSGSIQPSAVAFAGTAGEARCGRPCDDRRHPLAVPSTGSSRSAPVPTSVRQPSHGELSILPAETARCRVAARDTSDRGSRVSEGRATRTVTRHSLSYTRDTFRSSVRSNSAVGASPFRTPHRRLRLSRCSCFRSSLSVDNVVAVTRLDAPLVAVVGGEPPAVRSALVVGPERHEGSTAGPSASKRTDGPRSDSRSPPERASTRGRRATGSVRLTARKPGRRPTGTRWPARTGSRDTVTASPIADARVSVSRSPRLSRRYLVSLREGRVTASTTADGVLSSRCTPRSGCRRGTSGPASARATHRRTRCSEWRPARGTGRRQTGTRCRPHRRRCSRRLRPA